MTIDLSGKSREELAEIASKVEAAMATLEERKLQDAIDAVHRAAQEHGYSLEALIAEVQARPSGKNKAKNPPKYRNPADPSQTWTGRGRKPAWIKDAENAGIDLQEYEI